MPTNLPADGICIGSHSVCLLRAARLNADCSPEGGDSSGIITTAIVTLTATPDVQDDTTFEPEDGCGRTLFAYSRQGLTRRYNITGSVGDRVIRPFSSYRSGSGHSRTSRSCSWNP